MATKYQSEFKEKGFAPEKISNAGVQNILAEGNRQAGVLREQFAYEKAQRDNVLSAMKSNSAFEKQDRDKNFDAETKNRQQIQDRKKLNFDQQQTNRTNQANAQATVYKELAGLSKTAGKLYNDLEQDKFDKDYEDQMMRIMMGEVDVVKQAKYQDDEDQLMVASVENDTSANVLGALGAKPLEQQRIRSNSKGREYANNKAQAILTMQAFQPWAENQLKEKFPQVEDPQQKREILLSMLAPYMKETGLYGLKPEFMTAPLMEARKGVSKFFAQEDEAYTKKLQYQATESSQAGFLGDPENMVANAAQFLRDKTVELGGDRGRALDYVFQVAGSNMSQEEWEAFGRITFPGKNNPVSLDMEARWKKANLARDAARQQAYSSSETDDKIKREAYERKMLPLLEGASDKEKEMILKGYQDLGSNPGKLKSQILENYAGDVSANAVNFKGALEAKIRQAKEGMYSSAELERETDPRFAKNEELKNLAEQNSAWQEAKPVQDRSKSLVQIFLLNRKDQQQFNGLSLNHKRN